MRTPSQRRRTVLALLVGAVLVASACSRGAERLQTRRAHPSILVVSIDTLRADRLGCYGYGGATTPHLDGWAREGVLFERATTPTPITLPAHATLLTGLYPHRHGVRDNGVYRLPADVPTLATRLASAGYDTAAVVGSAVLDRQYGLARGFRRYDDPSSGGSGLAFAERNATAVTDAALAAARGLKHPALLFVHYFDPHAAYEPPPPFAERFQASPYDGEIAYVDSEIGRLRRELTLAGFLDDALVVVVWDHGEGLGEHGEATHGVFLYQGTLHVPWLLIAPGRVPAGRRVAAPVSLADVCPTLLDLAGLSGLPAPPAPSDGIALSTLLVGAPAENPPQRHFPLESEFGYNAYGWAPLKGLSDGRLKWIDAPEAELYDLQADGGERHDLAHARPDDARRLAALWTATVRDERRALVTSAGPQEAEQHARLRALGYVAGSAAPGPRPRGLPDPKTAIGSLELVNEARRQLGRQRPDAAIRLLEQARRAGPRNLSALTLLGVAHLTAGRPQAALAPLTEAARIGPAHADVFFNLGLAQLGAGNVDAAEGAWRTTLTLAPRYHDAAVNLIDLYSKTDRLPAAAETLLAARKQALTSPLLDLLDGRLAVARGDRPAARTALERALVGGLAPAAADEARALLASAGR